MDDSVLKSSFFIPSKVAYGVEGFLLLLLL